MTKSSAVKIDLAVNPLGDYREGSVVERRDGLTKEEFEQWRSSVDLDRYRVICVGWATVGGAR